jgi:hypothetical protein
MRCKFIILNKVENGILVSIKNGFATVIVDGYTCSDLIPITDIIDAHEEW